MIQEPDETNNEASKVVRIGSPSVTAGNVLVTGNLPTTVYTNSLFTVTGKAVYAINVNGITNTDYVVKGGAVQVAVSGSGGCVELRRYSHQYHRTFRKSYPGARIGRPEPIASA